MPDPDDGFGLNVQTLLRSGGRWSDAQVADLLGRMVSDGMRSGRSDVLWPYVESSGPNAAGVHRYDWSSTDATAATLARAGARWAPVLHGSPAWASTDATSLFAAPKPERYADFAAMAAAFAARYGPGGSFWAAHPEIPAHPVRSVEVWNEENSSVHWHAEPDPAAYGDLFLKTRSAVKAAAPVDVIVGGIVWNDDVAFLNGFLARVGDTPLDGVAIHPYAPTVFALAPNVQRMRAALDAAGRPGVPLLLNELGWPAAWDRAPQQFAIEGPVADDSRAGTTALAVEALGRSTCGISGIDIYDAIETEEPGPDVEGLMGVYRRDGSATRTSAALWDAVGRVGAEARRPTPPIPACGARGAPRTQVLPLDLAAAPTPEGCHLATVTYRGLPIEEAQVRVLSPFTGMKITDAAGHALVCPPVPGGNAGLRLVASIPGIASSNRAICDMAAGRCRSLAPAAACVLSSLTYRSVSKLRVARPRGLAVRAAGCSPQIGGFVRVRAALVLPRKAARKAGLRPARKDVPVARGTALLRDPGGQLTVPIRLTKAGRRALARQGTLAVTMQVTAREAGTQDTRTQRVRLVPTVRKKAAPRRRAGASR